MKLLSNSITNSSVIINLNIEKELPFIEGDEGKIEQLIIALFTNALEALEGRDGIITISTGLKECDISYLSKNRLEVIPEPGVFAYLEIKDTGCGMDEETQKKIFDPFFTTKFTGRGLGMSAVIGIVRSHRGAIFVESIKNSGTAVTVIFPLYRTECPEQYREIPEKKVTPLQARTILLVDDEDMLRESGKAILKRFGFNVITACDGQEAVEVYKKKSSEINCIIMDLSMPRMDGLTALKKIRQVNPGIKVILCSGYNEQMAIGNYTGYGLAGFLQKPYEIEKLREKLKNI
ncbi:MAG: response regulator [Candidatus Eremiobacterota bacterium]